MTYVVAHRGDSAAARENTPEAFRAAVEAGADLVELDIRTTRDGVSVVLHDERLLRLWHRTRRVADCTAAEVAALGHGECRIPTLAETLRQLAGLNAERGTHTGVLVETVSADDARAAVAVVQEFATDALATHVEVRWCGDTDAMLAVRGLLPTVPLAYNHTGGDLPHELLARLQPATVNVEWIHADAWLVDQVHRLGMEVACWTVDDAETMTWLLHLGVDSITTNQPRLLRRLVDRGTSPLALAAGRPSLPEPATAEVCGVDLHKALQVADELARWANAFTATASLGTVATKAHAADLVTEVDVAVERHVREAVAEAFGGEHLVVGEELGGAPEPGRPTWYLDPVDGTTNLANGLPWTSMSLALAVDRRPMVAAVAKPAGHHVLLAAEGLGATLDAQPLRLPRADTLAGRTVLLELDAHRMWPGMDVLLEGLAQQHCTPRVMGSGTLAMAGVAAGWGVAGVVHRFNPIDHLAGVFISHEAGAEVVGFDGARTLFPDGDGIVVAAPGAAELVLRTLGKA